MNVEEAMRMVRWETTGLMIKAENLSKGTSTFQVFWYISMVLVSLKSDNSLNTINFQALFSLQMAEKAIHQTTVKVSN